MLKIQHKNCNKDHF